MEDCNDRRRGNRTAAFKYGYVQCFTVDCPGMPGGALPQVPQVTVPVLPVPETLPALPQETPAAQPGAAQESTATPFAGIPVPTVPVIPQIPGSGME